MIAGPTFLFYSSAVNVTGALNWSEGGINSLKSVTKRSKRNKITKKRWWEIIINYGINPKTLRTDILPPPKSSTLFSAI
ncbi:hypothetical protein L873DRAFT_1514544 [Choiromyces venosus 120613-1]|uniref:Uncharacterized protein n=1 Tax=Choiromyces venosus 120613-1 TaxID=1336337 RepID=A0A3N4JAY3_9PEZI|nr:hypothetical protein L873DRAFT_1514544 [Choiromyces venosus 120613-1]